MELQNLVRLAIATATEGRSWKSYIRDAMRYRLASAHIGSRYLSNQFASEVAALAAMVLMEQDALDFDEPVPGLGIPSDFSFVADPVSIGDSVLSRHGDLLITCLSLTSARTGNVYQPMHSGYAMQIGSHGGPNLASALLAALLKHPASWAFTH